MNLRFDKLDMLLAGAAIILLLLDRYGGVLPLPHPDDPPIQVDSLHVLILHETAEQHKLTPGQADVIDDVTHYGKVRQWLDDHAIYRVFDKDVGGNPPDWVVESMKLHDGTIPWVLASNSHAGHFGALPDGIEPMLALLEEYAE